MRVRSPALTALVLLAACARDSAPSVPVYPLLADHALDAQVARTGRLPGDVRPLAYALDLSVDPARERFSGVVAIDIALDRPRAVIYLHAKNFAFGSVEAVQANGRQKPIAARARPVGDTGLVAIELAEPLLPGLATLHFQYDAAFGTRLTGLYKVEHAGAPYAFTQHEAISARETFPSFDEPRFKTPYDVTLRVPHGLTAIANTRETARERTGEVDVVHFARSEKLPSYLVALAVGPLDVVDGPILPANARRAHSLPIRGIAARGRGVELAYALQETPRYLERLEAYTDIGYPYDKLDLIAVPDFAAGAMENAGAITFRDSLLLLGKDADEGQKRRFADVNAHELAHQWFGNLVTMPWWDDVWLNESFATWMGTRVLDEVEPSYHAFRDELLGVHGAMEMDSQPSARRIREPVLSEHDIDNAFDAITYQKGGAVLRMFEGYLGEGRFRAAIRTYLREHTFANATADDLVRALTESTGDAQVGASFHAYLTNAGVPSVRAKLVCSEQGAKLSLSQARYTPIGVTLPTTEGVLLPFCAHYGSGERDAQACTLLPSEGTSELALPFEGKACPSFVHPNADGRGYYRYAVDGVVLRGLLDAQARLSPSERMSLVANVEAAMRSGELAADEGLNALFSLLRDPEREVLEAALDALRGVRDALVSDEQLPLYRARLRDVLGPRLATLGTLPAAGVEVGADEKLMRAVLVRALANDALDPKVLAELAGHGAKLLRGEPVDVLPKELYGAAFWALVAVDGGKALPAVIARLIAEQDGFLRARLLSALAQSPHPALSEQVLALSLGGQLRVNERVAPVFGQLGRRETRAIAYGYLKAHFREFAAAVTGHGGSAMFGALGAFCSEDAAKDAEASFRAQADALLGGPRELSLALESMRSCAAFANAQRAPAARALTAKPEPRTAK